MKVLIDMSFIRPDELTKSIPLYSFRLLHGLQELNVDDVSLLINGDLQDFFREKYPQFHTIPIKIESYWRMMNWRLKKCLYDSAYRRKISHETYDVVLTLDELKNRTTFSTKKKKISVIHDLKDLSIQTDDHLSHSVDFYRKLIDSADIIVAISEYTKQDILRHYDVAADKIKVIYNSITITEASKRPQNLIDGNFILYVNTLLEYKNPLTLLQAFNSVKDKIEERLVIVGKENEYWQNVLLPFIKNNDLEHRVQRLQNLAEEELRYLYNHAAVFVSSSQHEGFGYTPIEAAICCCPVICTKCEALPETTMMLLNYYEPADDYKELANKLMEVLKCPKDIASLTAVSDKYRQKYSPRVQAAQFFSLMQSL